MLISISFPGYTAEGPAESLHSVLQKKCAELPEVKMCTSVGEVHFDYIDLNSSLTDIADQRYYAFRFRTPPVLGNFVWSCHLNPGDSGSFYILAAQGQMDGFRQVSATKLLSDIPALGNRGDMFITQRLPAANFKANAEYIIWFSYKKDQDAGVMVSLNMFPPDKVISYQEAFPLLYKKEVKEVMVNQAADELEDF
ncbi:MAG: hypothetical protein HRU15_05015 [Planctomycetes bacterium]|nr:hypothetical protein [Planctomycetota bacterium]